VNRATFTTRILKPAAHVACAGPAAWLIWHAVGDGDLGADPVKTLQVTTGLTVLILLLVVLGVTPLRRYAHWSELVRLRRGLGLWAFTYLVAHFLIYIVFDQSLSFRLIWDDTVEHPRIAVGFVAFLLLIPLALTSTDAMIRRLGRRWGRLHRLIYPATALGVLHFLMVQKLDLREGMVYAAVFGGLMLLRVPGWVERAKQSA
jgi:methionine sulfoxide reductase heme-binding subunit